MYEIPIFPVPQAHGLVSEILSDLVFCQARNAGDLLVPILKPWNENPHAEADFRDTITVGAYATFSYEVLPLRIYVGAEWMKQSRDAKIMTCLHELIHVKDYLGGTLMLQERYYIAAPASMRQKSQMVAAGFQKFAVSIMSTLGEISAQAGVINLLPEASTKHWLAQKLDPELKLIRACAASARQQSDDMRLMFYLFATEKILFYGGIARRISGIADQLSQALLCAVGEVTELRRTTCSEVVLQETQPFFEAMASASNLQAFYDAYNQLLQHTIGAKILPLPVK